MLNEEEKEKRDRQRYEQLKRHLSDIQHIENGNLVPNNQKEFDGVMQEIKKLEDDYPGLNFFINSQSGAEVTSVPS